ncbi:MAG TPA: S1C family serine protease [Rubrobacter sp.]|nr:S1C family serine protease [Rubrobacter sp.]
MRDDFAVRAVPRPRERWGAILPVAGLVAVGCESAAADEPSADEVSRKIEPSVVQVNVSSIRTSPYGRQEAGGLGSGMIYRGDGHLITDNHVVEGPVAVNAAFADGSVEKREVVGGDPYSAVVKADRGEFTVEIEERR